MLSLGVNSCGAPKLNWNGEILVGDSKEKALIGKVNGVIDRVPADDPRFDQMTCTDDMAGLTAAYDDLISQCKSWK